MKMIPKILLTVIVILFSMDTNAAKYALVIGGGPYPKESQASIELNTKWIINAVKKQTSAKITRILYTDGNNPGIDVYRKVENNSKISLFEPIARVYGKEHQNSYEFYSSKIENNSGSTAYENVVDMLKSTFSSLKNGDELFIIFQGHGGYDANNPNNNFLRLWHDGKLTVTKLGSLMSKVPNNVTIRFLLPQCFSGAFTNLMYKDQSYKKGLTKANICGFTAQRQDLGSEGCTPSVDTGTYRDYSSYLFSALLGKTINGTPIKANPDINKDGIITLREAHLYTLAHAFSVDYSRSTSDDYLQNWLPWYFKWIPDSREPDNVYMKIALDIASQYNMQGQGNTLVHNVSVKMSQLDAKLKENMEIKQTLAKSIRNAQKIIRQELSFRWPQLDSPYTYQYTQLLSSKLDEIVTYIKEDKRYPGLVENQKKVEELTAQDLDTRREIVQMIKILRMRKLGRTLALFNRYATKKAKDEYSKLVSCEEARL